MSVVDAEAVLEAVSSKSVACDPVTASDYANRLMGFYPAREVNDPVTFAAGMAANFAALPRNIVKRVCDPVKGLPSRLKFLPTIADVREALDAERVKRDRIIGNATWVIREAKRQADEAAHDAKIVAERASMTTEERAARANAIRARLKTNVIEPEPFRAASGMASRAAVAADAVHCQERASPERVAELMAEHDREAAALAKPTPGTDEAAA